MRRVLGIILVTLGSWSAVGVRDAGARAAGAADLHPYPGLPSTADAIAERLDPTGVETAFAAGVAIGERAPGFTLEDAQGRWTGPADLEGRWAVLAFTDDRKALAPLGAIAGELGRGGARLVGITLDSRAALESFASRRAIPFTLLSDPAGEVSRAFGRYDPEGEAVQPGLVLLDAGGVVRHVLDGPLPAAAEVLSFVQEAMAEH